MFYHTSEWLYWGQIAIFVFTENYLELFVWRPDFIWENYSDGWRIKTFKFEIDKKYLIKEQKMCTNKYEYSTSGANLLLDVKITTIIDFNK